MSYQQETRYRRSRTFNVRHVHGEEFVEEFLENGRPSGGRKVSLRAKPIIFSTWPKMGELLAKISLRPPSNARNSFEQRRSFNGEGTYNIGEKTI